MSDVELARIRGHLAEGKARAALSELRGLGENVVLRDPRLLACRVWAHLEAGDEMRAAHDLLRLLDTTGLAKLPEDIGPGGLSGLLAAFGPEGKRSLGGALGKWAHARQIPIADAETILASFPHSDWPLDLLVASVERAESRGEVDAVARAKLQHLQRTAPADARVAALQKRIVGTPQDVERRVKDEARRREEGKPITVEYVASKFLVELPAAFCAAWSRSGGHESARRQGRKRGGAILRDVEFFPLTMGSLTRMDEICPQLSKRLPPGPGTTSRPRVETRRVLPFARIGEDVLALDLSHPLPGAGDFPVLRFRPDRIEVVAASTAQWLSQQGT